MSKLTAGRPICVDYMTARTTMLAHRRWRDWLGTYHGHESGGHYPSVLGSQDITAEVVIEQLPEADSMRSQAQWLQLHGIEELVAEGRTVWAAEAAHPGLHAMRMRSRIAESEALLDPQGLGGFIVLAWQLGMHSLDAASAEYKALTPSAVTAQAAIANDDLECRAPLNAEVQEMLEPTFDKWMSEHAARVDSLADQWRQSGAG